MQSYTWSGYRRKQFNQCSFICCESQIKKGLKGSQNSGDEETDGEATVGQQQGGKTQSRI